MSIEQTNQLILLILNSVLMSLLSAILLGGAWLRQNTLSRQLHQARVRYRQLSQQSAPDPWVEPALAQSTPMQLRAELKADLKKVRDRRQQLSTQYRWSHVGMLMLHGVLMVFGISLFTLALRSLLAFDLLISTALFLFALGAGGLIAGTGCILIDLAQGNSGGDSVGHSLGKAMAQLARWWHKQSQRPQWHNAWQANWKKQPAWKKQPLAMLMPVKTPSTPGPDRQHPRKAGR